MTPAVRHPALPRNINYAVLEGAYEDLNTPFLSNNQQAKTLYTLVCYCI
jgi:hypothetical protein